jgi:TolA-binding protein
MMKAKRRLTRREIKEDKLVTYTYKVTDFFNKNSKLVTGVAIGLVLVAVIAVMMVRSKQQAEQLASAKMAEAMIYYDQMNYDKAIPLLKDVIEKYDGTKSAGFATFYLANSYFNKKEYDKAKTYYKKYLDDYGDDDLMASSALAGIASCLDAEGKTEAAAQKFVEAAHKYPKVFSAPDNLFNAALAYQKLGKKQEARKILEEIKKKYPKAYIKDDVEMLLTQLQ